MEAPRTLFEALKEGGVTELQRYVAEGRQEDLYLEFKTTKCPMENDDKKNLAMAVGGFANSEGGVIVWGVYAAKDRDNVDAAQSLQPVIGVKRLLSQLNEYISRLVVPAVEGVEHHLIPDSSGGDTGFVVTLVPKGQGLPHMSMAQGQQRYYIRAGDSFLPMEHFMLADRFGRRPQPKLELTHRWERSSNKTYLVLGIKNVGKGIALYPALHVQERIGDNFSLYALDERFDIPADPRRFGLAERVRTIQRPSPLWRIFAGGSEHAIHPGTSLEVVRALGWVMPRQKENVDWRALTFRYSLYCDGFGLVEAEMTISADEMCRAATGP